MIEPLRGPINSNTVFALRGAFAHTPTIDRFELTEDAFLVCDNAKVAGLFPVLPEQYRDIPVFDYRGKLIIPGMCDLHIHAPQYSFRGIGKNRESPLTRDWFARYAFPDESRYADLDYARRAYGRFVEDLKKTPTTRLCIFATLHRPATVLLMELLDQAGFAAYVGKLNMDRNSIAGLQEETGESIAETVRWLDETGNRFAEVKPVISPRYFPSCTSACSAALGKLAKERNLPVQSHLSEDLDELAWVRQLDPTLGCYAEAYDRHGLLGGERPAVMAHCVYPQDGEIELLARRNVLVAHCPQSNLSGSGMSAPVMEYLRRGIKVGLGTDVAGGFSLLMNRIIVDAIIASRISFAFKGFPGDKGEEKAGTGFLSLANAFYLATKGGGALWDNAGSFETGAPFDAVVWDDSRHADLVPRSLYERVERMVSLADDRDLAAKYIAGKLMYTRQ
jgi:guanine deaminase